MKQENKEELVCCTTSCEQPLDQNYWNEQWISENTKWDIGFASPAIVEFFDKFQNKNARILIPGCGNAYEAEYLVQQGFTNITLVDFAPKAVEILQVKFEKYPQISVVCKDFFDIEEQFDVIIEQTFLSALPPYFRPKYAWKMYHLLAKNGILTGLLFNRSFETNPPFGGSKEEYEQLFKGAFLWDKMEISDKSIAPRMGFEVFLELRKNDETTVQLYNFKGITCNGCMTSVTEKIKALPKAINVQMNTDFSELLIVSEEELPLNLLQEIVSYDENYSIELH